MAWRCVNNTRALRLLEWSSIKLCGGRRVSAHDRGTAQRIHTCRHTCLVRPVVLGRNVVCAGAGCGVTDRQAHRAPQLVQIGVRLRAVGWQWQLVAACALRLGVGPCEAHQQQDQGSGPQLHGVQTRVGTAQEGRCAVKQARVIPWVKSEWRKSVATKRALQILQYNTRLSLSAVIYC